MDEKALNRRKFLKISLGAAGVLAAAAASPMAFFSNSNKATAASSEVMPPQKIRAWCMVIDLKKCEGCVTLGTPPHCTQACIQGHYVPQGQEWIQVYHVELPGGGSYFMPTPCYQCENAPCVNVCPVAATYHDRSGIVLIDHHRCIGCRLCMAA